MRCESDRTPSPCFQLQCCGADGPSDWSRSVYNGWREADNAPEIGIPRTPGDIAVAVGLTEFNVPTSCCYEPQTAQCQAAVRDVRLGAIPKGKIFEKVRISTTFFFTSQ